MYVLKWASLCQHPLHYSASDYVPSVRVLDPATPAIMLRCYIKEWYTDHEPSHSESKRLLARAMLRLDHGCQCDFTSTLRVYRCMSMCVCVFLCVCVGSCVIGDPPLTAEISQPAITSQASTLSHLANKAVLLSHGFFHSCKMCAVFCERTRGDGSCACWFSGLAPQPCADGDHHQRDEQVGLREVGIATTGARGKEACQGAPEFLQQRLGVLTIGPSRYDGRLITVHFAQTFSLFDG